LKTKASKLARRPVIVKALPDFGTYHHTSPEDSEKIRKTVKGRFEKAFSDLPFSREDGLKILDIGCGLGFLSCVCAGYYSNARITAFDTFEGVSLENSSLARAKENAKVMGYSERITFRKKDFFRSDYSRGKFDLFVSNLVFHNFTKKRLKAYETLEQWMTPRSHAVLGDLYFEYKRDYKQLKSLFGKVEELPRSSMMAGTYKILVISEPNK